MTGVKLFTTGLDNFVGPSDIELYSEKAVKARKHITESSGEGHEFLGWTRLPMDTPEALIQRIEYEALRLKKQSQAVVVVGIGGSYLGTKAICEALSPSDFDWKTGFPRILYAGHHLDTAGLTRLLNYLNGIDYSIIVISKSGTTTEPAVAFRFLKKAIEEKYGKAGAKNRIVAITDASRGALKTMADREGYATFVIPDDVGGRFSVLTPVGLLPVAVAGHNIRQLLSGAVAMQQHVEKENDPIRNEASRYAIMRNILLDKGKTTEILAVYNPALLFVAEWWKQLFGESEGKTGKGIFPASVGFTTDLHSMGQYIQEGMRNLFETVLWIEKEESELLLPSDPHDPDGLNYLSNTPLSHINRMASRGTMLAHTDGQVPNMEISLPLLNEYHLGELIYFYEMACAISGYMLGVNPFDQPGVEAYKTNMFALLGKPGFEDLAKTLRSRMA